MRLNASALQNRNEWEKAGFVLPKFSLEKMRADTRKTPKWVHFGAGNIFRAFPAVCLQDLLDTGDETSGVIVAEGFDFEIIDAVFTPHDNLTLAVTLRADGEIEKTVVGSIAEALKVDTGHSDFSRLKEIFQTPSLQMVSFTITEKGYELRRDGAYFPDVEKDLLSGPERPRSYMGKVAALLYHRYQAGRLPVAMVSMDNCSHNGDKLRAAIETFAFAWTKAGLVDAGFADYASNQDLVSYPWTMIDKITPRPDDGVKATLLETGFEDVTPVVTQKNTYVAPFVNAEETEYLVIEDSFPNGRIPLDKAGIIYTDRSTVDKIEKMKVCTCLNPLHTALAVFGCLLSYKRISDEMNDADLRKLVQGIGYDESLCVVVDPGIINPRDFLTRCLDVRFPNPFMPDTPQRIACDTSQKLPIRFGETVKAYHERPDLDVGSLTLIPLVYAGWLRYLLGIDDNGAVFTRSPDPMLHALDTQMEGIRLGDKGPFHEKLVPVLSNKTIFGVDLYAVGLGHKVEAVFSEMMAGPGMVRATLRKYVQTKLQKNG